MTDTLRRLKRYWVRERHIHGEDQYVKSQIEPMKLKLMVDAADVEAVLADNAELLKYACECDLMYGFTCHVHNANYHPGQALLDALAAKDLRIKELELEKQNDCSLAEQQLAAKEAVVLWLLGENGDFPVRPDGAGLYWWRSELRKRWKEASIAQLEARVKELEGQR